MEQACLIVTECQCQCGESFEAESVQFKYAPGHSPSARNKERQKGRSRKKPNGFNYTPPAKTGPSVAEALSAKPSCCDKCGNSFLVQDDITDIQASALVPYVELIEWYCPICSKRFAAVSLLAQQRHERTVDIVR